MPRKPAPGTRDRILDNAARLFYEHGVHEVGLQQVIDESCCGKNLLYREFPSKDDLVVAWLERSAADWNAAVAQIIDDHPDDPVAQLSAVVRAATAPCEDRGYRGCALRNTHAEFPDPEHPAHRVAVHYLRDVRALLLSLSEAAGARDPEALADRLMLIIDGAVSNASLLGDDGAVSEAASFADDVIATATTDR